MATSIPSATTPGGLSANLFCMASMLVWATAFPAVNFLLPMIPPIPLAALRMVVAVAALVPLWLLREGRGALTQVNWRKAIWVGGIGYGIGSILLVVSQHMTDAVTVAVISAAMPVVGIALECALDGRRLTVLLLFGLLLSLGGGVYAYSARLDGMGLGLGALLALVAVVAYCWASRLTVTGFPGLTPLGRSAVTLVGATSATSVIALGQAAWGGSGIEWAELGWQGWGVLVLYGLGSLAVSQLLWVIGVGRLGIGIASMHINAAPFYVMAFMFALGHPWNWGQALGALIVGAGVLVAQSDGFGRGRGLTKG